MKRIVTLLIALILVITMSACGVETNEPVQSESDDISSVLLDENESDSEDTATTSSIEESSEETSTDLSNSIVDVKDAAEYSAELVRIAAKIAEAAGDL